MASSFLFPKQRFKTFVLLRLFFPGVLMAGLLSAFKEKPHLLFKKWGFVGMLHDQPFDRIAGIHKAEVKVI